MGLDYDRYVVLESGNARVYTGGSNSKKFEKISNEPGMLDHRLEGEIPLYLLYTNEDID